MKRALTTLGLLYISSIIVSLLAKVIFLLVHLGQSANLGFSLLLETLIRGISLDISTAGYIIALPLLLTIAAVWIGRFVSSRIWQYILMGYFALISTITALIVAIDANLYSYWGYRIDATLIPYLTSAKDAAASLTFGDVALATTIFAAVISASIYLYFKAIRHYEITSMTLRQRSLATPLLLLVAGFVFLGIRGGVSASVANVSKVYFSPIQYANHAAVNPVFSLVSSVGRLRDYDELYPFYPKEELYERFSQFGGEALQSDKQPTKIIKNKRPNVAIIICESYTRHIMDLEIEGRSVMPNLRRIAAEGIDFERAYAAGARTDKGVATALSGFPSQPTISIMKIPAKSRNLASVASSLGAEGYTSSFYYGGDLNFMDMASYLYSTGWQNLMWQRDIHSEEGPRNWGYSDGVTMNLFANEVIRLNDQGNPFLAGLLTLSSHEPFDVPEQLGFDDPMINSMAYSDKMLGKMVDQLRNSKAWDNLLVIIVADHTYGGFPADVEYNSPKRHHIPLILSGGALTKNSVETDIISQMDIPATLLSQMNINHAQYPFSRDFYSRDTKNIGTGYYTFSDGFGVVNNSEAILYDNKMQRAATSTPLSGNVDFSNNKLNPTQNNLLEIGKATLQMTHEIIENL